MSADERSAADAVYILQAVARLLRASPIKSLDPNWADLHAGYLEDAAGAVVRDAQLDPQEVKDGAKYVGSEWESALIPILFGEDQALDIIRRARANGRS